MNKILLLLFLISSSGIYGQFITDNADTLYGNEWIEFDKKYYKISVAEDGIYRISYDVLTNAGIPVEELSGANFQMVHLGKTYPIYTSQSGNLEQGDFIEFYGRRNRGELDEVFYEDPEAMQLNPEYSLFTDTAAYFLTWNTGSGNLRVNELLTPSEGIDITPEEFYMHKEKLVLSSRVQKPTRNGSHNVRYSHFDVGEGFGGPLRQNNEVSLRASNIYSSGPTPSVDIRFTTNATFHQIDFLINGDKRADFEHSAYLLRQEHVEFPLEDLVTNNRIRLEGTVDQFDRNVMSVVSLNYPRAFDFDNESYFEFFMFANSSQKYAVVDRFDGGESPVIYDPGSGTRIIPFVEDGSYKVLIPPSTKDRELIAFDGEDAVKEVEDLERIEFVDYREMDGEFIIISHPRLMEGAVDMVSEYASYRSSEAGGGYRSVVVNVEDLYEQFSYGVHRHSYSVKNFVNWAARNWSDPKYVFLLGKGREYGDYRTKAQIEDPQNASYFIPTYGLPGSDNLLVSRGNLSTAHVISTGRVAAKSVEDVQLYLDKVKEHEDFSASSIEERIWRKKVMHMAGAETALQESIGGYLDAMKDSIEQSEFGGSVITFKKSSTAPIQDTEVDALLRTIDAGISLMTFFGHSSVGTFDFSIDDVNKLSNFGRYPMVISLGCYSGNIHSTSFGISEQYVLTAQRGAIGFVASSSTAYVRPQGLFGISLYENLGNEYLNQPIGRAIQDILIETDDLTNINNKILNEQMTYHGDPALVLSNVDGPDYVFDYESFRTKPNLVDSNQDDFEIEFRVINLGVAIEDSLEIKLEHYGANESLQLSKTFKIKSPKFDTTMSVIIPNNDFTNIGKNRITGIIDPNDEIPELPLGMAESNNTVVSPEGEEGYVFYTINNSARPLSPCNYGIYNKEEVVLQASTYNSLAKEVQTFVLEIDTTQYFNSDSKISSTILSDGGLIEWSPQGEFDPGTVYYWRISPDSLDSEVGYRWESSSFVYLPNSTEGWNQSHYFQFEDNEYEGLLLNEERKFVYDTSTLSLKVHNALWDPNSVGFQYNYQNFSPSAKPWAFMQEGVAVLVVDLNPASVWINEGGDYGSIETSNFGSFNTFGFLTETPEQREVLVNFLENVIPEGNMVYFVTIMRGVESNFYPDQWAGDSEIYGNNLYDVLESEGSALVRNLETTGSLPYNFVYKKGGGVLAESLASNIFDNVKAEAFIPLLGESGSMKTIEVGPASSWDRIEIDTEELTSGDTIKLTVLGIDNVGNETELKSVTNSDEIDIQDIDAEVYDKLRLIYYSKDTENRTNANLNHIRVYFESIPELVFSGGNEFVFNRDTLHQGEPLEISIPIRNISNYNIPDSISISVEIQDSKNNVIFTSDKIPPLPMNDEYLFNYSYDTDAMVGDYQVSINLNEDGQIKEKFDYNNFGVRSLHVLQDIRNPLTEVSFDGQKIIDGDIVSPTPQIVIEVKDENEYLMLDDPGLMEIALHYPDGSEEIIADNDNRISFFPGTLENENTAQIEFTPDLTEDGEYRLEVRSFDRSNNISGDIDYERSFQVINEQQISNVLNYPNPFSTSTEFVFTLTGREIPQEMKIQILTVNGTTVKEIFKEELGPLRIGINRTSYKWDGTDDFGNKLANGVYLYRVIAKSQEGNIKKRTSSIDGLFHNNIGKLVILR